MIRLIKKSELQAAVDRAAAELSRPPNPDVKLAREAPVTTVNNKPYVESRRNEARRRLREMGIACR